jgi:hypothetical protein
MKTTLFATLLSLVPVAALAVPTEGPAETYGAFTGKVKLTQVMCIRAPCYPIVELVGDDGSSMNIRGEMLRDVESLRGKEITVKGLVSNGSMNVSAVAPGRSKDFVTGTVRNTTSCNKMLPPVCNYSVDIVTADGGVVRVTDEKYAKGLSQLDGATVSIKGTVTNTPCPPGMMCIQLYQPTLWPLNGANIWVKGRISDALIATTWAEGVEAPRYYIGFPNGGESFLYTNKMWHDRIDADAWFSGAFDGEKFRATKAGYGMVPDPLVDPFFPWGGNESTGSNVGLNDDTDGDVVVAGGASSAAGAQSAGMARQ